jgi:hypothetical protein
VKYRFRALVLGLIATHRGMAAAIGYGNRKQWLDDYGDDFMKLRS